MEEISALGETLDVHGAEIRKVSAMIVAQQRHEGSNIELILQTQMEMIKYEMTQINRHIGLMYEATHKGKNKNIFPWF